MTRIADRLLVETPVSTSRSDRAYIEERGGLQVLRESIIKAVRFDVDNVAAYIGDSGDYKVGSDRWVITNPDTFPNVAPPYPISWMEYRRPASVASFADVDEFNRKRGSHGWHLDCVRAGLDEEGCLHKEDLFGRPIMPERTAVLLEAQKVDWTRTVMPDGTLHLSQGWSASDLGTAVQAGLISVPGTNEYGVDWYWAVMVQAYMAPFGDRGPVVQSPSYELHIDPEGKLLHVSFAGDAGAAASFNDCLAPALLAISFLHCRNVLAEPEAPRPPRLLRAYERRHGVPLVRFHTLQIEPMRKVLTSAGAEETGLHKALHIARGHFRDYTEGRGLFGKVHGVFWVDSHVRGRASEGTVLKDYNVHAPRVPA